MLPALFDWAKKSLDVMVITEKSLRHFQDTLI